ncbi:Lipase/lipooxygenase [Abeliophyllum distichum]|uniref:Lipase/lipooxygenase n=1 Tax=Abeliophyllum distichum TaxID=126358 RepID=A0ABD1Q3D2_9LAMI
MESLTTKLSFSASPTTFPLKHPRNLIRITTFRSHFHHFPVILCYKKYNFQDFQEYAKPSRLLPATEVNVFTDASLKKTVTSFKTSRSECLYRVKLKTSNIYGSDLSDINSRVLLCLIDENGDSILQRLPACLTDNPLWSTDKVIFDVLHFQRGSVDEFSFEGPELGKVVAVWIGVESGQWRVGDLSLTVICHHEPPSAENDQKSIKHNGLEYNFWVEDTLVGEGSEISMMEFRPQSVTAFSEDEFTYFNQKSSYASLSNSNYTVSNEESMKEYADLKFSLLFYDALLILAGSSITSFLAGDNASFAFIMGGIGGFFYLVFLQRSVDELPIPELVSRERTGNSSEMFRRLKGPLSSLALAFALTIITVKYASGDSSVKLTPKDLIFGMMGFLMCKVSVVLAAFKPMAIGSRENK